MPASSDCPGAYHRRCVAEMQLRLESIAAKRVEEVDAEDAVDAIVAPSPLRGERTGASPVIPVLRADVPCGALRRHERHREDVSAAAAEDRSEERRVGKEGRSRW